MKKKKDGVMKMVLSKIEEKLWTEWMQLSTSICMWLVPWPGGVLIKVFALHLWESLCFVDEDEN